MGTNNQRTIQAYEQHVPEYIQGTPQQVTAWSSIEVWLKEALDGLQKDARILEFGSATGRDAEYIQAMGYSVDCTDATQAFVDLLQQKGLAARRLNAITDDLDGPFDLVIANAVLLHFTREETGQVLRNVLQALGDNGRFAFTLKQGDGEEWSEAKLGAPRYFCYWQEADIRQQLEVTGYRNIRITSDTSPTTGVAWLQVIAYK